MRPILAFAGLLSGLSLLGCAGGVPQCQYLAPPQMPERGIIGFPADQSQEPMLPYNPDWVSTNPSLPVIGSPGHPCAGQPGHPGRLS